MEPLEQLLGSKSHLIIGQKFEIMLDIIRVLGDLARYRLKIHHFLELLEHLLGSKSHLIIGPNKRNARLY